MMWTKPVNCAVFLSVVLVLAGCGATEAERHAFYVKGEHKYCAVHHVRLERDIGPVIRTRPHNWQGYRQSSRGFPNPGSSFSGGCMGASWDSLGTGGVLYCPVCRIAEAKWLAAKQKGHKRKLLRRAEKVSDINMEGKYGYTLLVEAASYGYIDVVRELIDNGADVNARDSFGRTALHWAAEANHREIVQLLVDAGADVNARDIDGRTPLHDAAWCASKPVVSVLVQSSAEINAEDNDGTNSGATPLWFATAFNSRHKDVASYLEKHGGVHDPAFIRRIEEAADVNVRDEDGRTLLHEAASEGYFTAVKLLIERGSDVSARDDFGATPLHMSVCHVGIMKMLLDCGADINAKDGGEGRTPLHESANGGCVEGTVFLIDSGADLESRDELGETPLHEAAQSGHLEIVKLLIEAGADVNVENFTGETALTLAEKRSWCKEVVEFLREYVTKKKAEQ